MDKDKELEFTDLEFSDFDFPDFPLSDFDDEVFSSLKKDLDSDLFNEMIQESDDKFKEMAKELDNLKISDFPVFDSEFPKIDAEFPPIEAIK